MPSTLLRYLHGNTLFPSSDVSLATWIGNWINIYAPLRCKSGATIQRYHQLANYIAAGNTPELAAAAAAPLSGLTHQMLEAALLSLFHAPAIRHSHLSARTVRHLGSLLTVSLRKAALLDLIDVNPMTKVELPSFTSPEVRPLLPLEIAALRRVCRERGDYTFPLVELALASGCRRGEMLALEWTDIAWDTRVVAVSKSIEETRSGIRVKSTKSGKSRLLTLPAGAVDALQDHRRSQAAGGSLVFSGPNGRYLRPSVVSQCIVRRLLRADVRQASLHTLRHTHATYLLSRGVPLATISVRLGHADVDVTARIYCHALPPDDQRAADAWDRLLSSI